MTGQELKEKLLKANVPFNIIAERLGITAQSLNSYFKGKDVRSNTIERIAEAIDVTMSFFYPTDGNNAVANGDSSIAVNNITGNIEAGDNAALIERVKLLEQLLAERERVIEEKERLINVLMEK